MKPELWPLNHEARTAAAGTTTEPRGYNSGHRNHGNSKAVNEATTVAVGTVKREP